MSRSNTCRKSFKKFDQLKYCTCEMCCLGKGSYGTVYRGIFKSRRATSFLGIITGSSTDAAIKRVLKSSAQLEIEVLRKVKGHSNVLQLFRAEENDPEFWYIATELCAGTLIDLVMGTYKGPLVGTNCQIVHQVTSGVDHLHSNNIIHRDLKPSNILISIPKRIDDNPMMKVADFGMSRIIPQDKSHMTRTKTNNGYSSVLRPFGTDGWIAPEIINGEQRYTKSADIFPLGLIFAFTLSGGRHPFDDGALKDEETESEMQKRAANRNERVKNNEPMTLTVDQLKDEDRIAFTLIQSMIDPDPTKRPSAAKILKKKYFKSIIQKEKDTQQKEEELIKLCQHSELDATVFERFCQLVMDKKAVDVNYTNTEHSRTPLMLLCGYNKSDNLDRCIEVLFQRRDIDVNKTDKNGNNALMLMCRNSNSDKIAEVTTMLTGKQIAVNQTNKYGMSALMGLCAFSKSDKIVQVAQLLIQHSVQVNQLDKLERNALMLLCRLSKSDKIVEVAQTLISNGIAVNETDKNGHNALMMLCESSKTKKIVQVAQLLIENGIDVNQTDKKGYNALMLLCQYSKNETIVKVVQLLIANGVDVQHKDNNGRTAANYFKSRNDVELPKEKKKKLLQLLEPSFLRKMFNWLSIFNRS